MEIETFLAQVASTIESNKCFVSAKEAKEKSRQSTGEEASWALIERQPDFNEDHLDLSMKALTFIRGYDGNNAFLKGLRTLAGNDDIGVAQADRAAWIIPAYERSLQEATPEGFGANSKFVSEVGAEVAFRGTVANVRVVGTAFGKKQIVTVQDANSNVFVYWPSNRELPLTSGQEVRVVGKIKAHKVYEGVNQNVITRAKIVAVPKAA